jgi:phytoene dehydrogenase-like protein
MTVQLRARVRKVLVDRRRVVGVASTDGTEIRSDVVVANVNAKTLYLDLIGAEHLPRRVCRAAASYKYDCDDVEGILVYRNSSMLGGGQVGLVWFDLGDRDQRYAEVADLLEQAV